MLGKTLLGRYTVIKELRRGGFAKTYLAEDRCLPGKPLCVVKQFKPRNITKSIDLLTARRLFEREAQVLYQLGNHDQIPQLLAHFEDQGEFFLVQELVEGHDLTQELVAGEQLSEVKVIELLQEILKVLEFVHQRGVIHRDIKPSNLMRRKKDNKIVLIDFGAVKQIDVQSEHAPTVIGSVGYTPPEQMDGKPQFCSDIYAVGVLGIQALTGVPAEQLRTKRDPWTGEPTIIWGHQMQVNDKLAEVLNKMVRIDTGARCQTAAEALIALQQLTPTPLSLWQRIARLLGIRLNQR